MGCDIHLKVEVKTKNGWELYASPKIEGWYELFAKMAGVRNYAEKTPIAEPKGLPDDMAYLTRKSAESWKEDGHSWSWLSSDEIRELSDWLNARGAKSKYFLDYDLDWSVLHTSLEGNSFADDPGNFPGYIKDVRFVFWFDC